MKEIDTTKHTNDFDDEIDLRELVFVLVQGKWIITCVSAFHKLYFLNNYIKINWRLRSESNRRRRICSPLHDHSATQPKDEIVAF